MQSAVKRFRLGSDRLVSPEETLSRMSGFRERMGITRLANITGLDVVGIPVVAAMRPNSRSVAVSMGKGLTLAAAMVSALMESIESWHAERIDQPLRLASAKELARTCLIADIKRLPRTVASGFHSNARILWIEGLDLVSNRSCWLPFDLVHTNFTLPLPPSAGAFFMGSNGLASGNHIYEAVSHAICEVVERDATTLWRFKDESSHRASKIDLATVDDPGCLEVLARINQAGLAVAVWDVTSDIRIATFLCELVDRSASGLLPMSPTAGMGTHPRRGIAMLRALTEAVQTRLMMIAGVRDDKGIESYRRALESPDAGEALRRVAGTGEASFLAAPDNDVATFEDDVAWELARLREAGLNQVLVVDLTRQELEVPVVRVVVAGLEPPIEGPFYVPGERARRAQGA